MVSKQSEEPPEYDFHDKRPSDTEFERREREYANLTETQYGYLRENVWDENGWRCWYESWTNAKPPEYCEAMWDKFYCWPATPPDTIVYRRCPNAENFLTGQVESSRAVRICNGSGLWQWGTWTNFSACLTMPPNCTDCKGGEANPFMQAQTYIYFYGCLISLVLLSITMFIFCYFKALQCSRVTIHKHLVMSFILRFLITVIITGSILTESMQEMRSTAWVCRAIITLTYYMSMANIFWMFVEGFFLHNRVAVSVFNTENSFVTFYIIGWVIPGLFVLVWVCVTYLTDTTKCWTISLSSLTFLLLAIPVGLALSINTVFLLNIIRILVTKLRANNTMETAQIRKAVRATAVLFPLLGVINLAYFFQPSDTSSVQHEIYRITNAIIQPLQGVLVSVVYCFLNGEVQTAIRKYLQRRRILKIGHSRNRRPSSRTSSLILSQTEVRHTFIRRHGNQAGRYGNGSGVFAKRQKCQSDPSISERNVRKSSFAQIRSLRKSQSTSDNVLRGLCSCRFHRMTPNPPMKLEPVRSASVSPNESVETNMSDICL